MGRWPVCARNRVAAEVRCTEIPNAPTPRCRDFSTDLFPPPIGTILNIRDNLPNGWPMCRRPEQRTLPVTAASTTLARNLLRSSDAVLGGATLGEVIAVGTIGLFGSCVGESNSACFQLNTKRVRSAWLSGNVTNRGRATLRCLANLAAASGSAPRGATASGARARAAVEPSRVKRPTATRRGRASEAAATPRPH